MGLTLENETDRNANEDSGSEAGSSDSAEEERGLEAFEDVLSSWLTAAHSKTSQALMKAQASLPLRPRTAGNPSSGQSTLARIQEQQQQLMQEETMPSGGSQAAARNGKKSKGARNKEAADTARAVVVAEDEEEQEEPDSPTGIEGWKDVLSGWATTAGVAAPPQHAQQVDSNSVGQPGEKPSHQQALPKPSDGAPDWLADVSSDEEDEEEKHDSIVPPSTSSITESQLNTAVSQEGFSDTDRQSTQAGAVNLNLGRQQLPQHGQHGGIASAPAAPFPPSTLQGCSVPTDSVMSTSGISSQDLRLEGDLLSRARSDPAALWPNSAPGFPPRAGPDQPALPPVATSVPATVYPADQGLPAQVGTF